MEAVLVLGHISSVFGPAPCVPGQVRIGWFPRESVLAEVGPPSGGLLTAGLASRARPRRALHDDFVVVLTKCFHSPRLEHGPRSLTYVRVQGRQPPVRNESEGALVVLR